MATAMLGCAICLSSDFLVLDLLSTNHFWIAYTNESIPCNWKDECKTRYLVLKKIYVDNQDFVSPNFKVGGTTNFFFMGVFEITQRQWELVMGDRPSYFRNKDYYAMRPVESVSYDRILEDFDSFIKRLRRNFNLPGLDLPSENQWEYACRADSSGFWGTNETFSSLLENVETFARVIESTPNGDMFVGDWNPRMNWYRLIGDSPIRRFPPQKGGTIPVGSYPPNGYGLYDMLGNVSELCKGWYGTSDFARRPVRGGGWMDSLSHATISRRTYMPSDGKYCEARDVGFRIVYNLMDSGCPTGFVGMLEPSLYYIPDVEEGEPFNIDVVSDRKRTKSTTLTNCTAKSISITSVDLGNLNIIVNLSTNCIAPYGATRLDVTLDRGFEKSVTRAGTSFDDTFFLETGDGLKIPIRISGWFFYVKKTERPGR